MTGDRVMQQPMCRSGQFRAQVVVPMKPLAASKSRLSGALDAQRRALLSLWMLERVVAAAWRCPGVGEVVVIGGDAAVRSLCEAHRARWMPQTGEDLDSTLAAALQASRSGGWSAMLFLAGDLPWLRAAEVDALLVAGGGGSETAPRLRPTAPGLSAPLVLGPALRGGTNAVLVPAGLDFRFQMGPGSFRRHLRQARQLGVRWLIVECPGVTRDVDLPTDLAKLEQALPDLWRQVAETGRFLLTSSGAGVEAR